MFCSACRLSWYAAGVAAGPVSFIVRPQKAQAMVPFPELHRESTLELPVVGALSTIASGLLLPVSWVLGIIALVPCGLWLAHAAWLGIRNARLRRAWSRQFARRVGWRQFRSALAAGPERFVVHVRYFGGFDATPLRPAVVLEDRGTGELAAVHPASWRALRVCEQFGVQLIRR